MNARKNARAIHNPARDVVEKLAALESAACGAAAMEPGHVFLALLRLCVMPTDDILNAAGAAHSLTLAVEIAALKNVFHHLPTNKIENALNAGRDIIQQFEAKSAPAPGNDTETILTRAITATRTTAGAFLVHLLCILLKKHGTPFQDILKRCGTDRLSLFGRAQCMLPPPTPNASVPHTPRDAASVINISPLDDFGRNLSLFAARGALEPIAGRSAEIKRMVRVLLRSRDNHALLIGDPGVGKTSVALGLAHETTRGDALDFVRNMIVYEVDTGLLMATGSLKNTIKKIQTEFARARKNNPRLMLVLFMDEIQELLGLNPMAAPASTLTAALISQMEQGNIRIVGACTGAVHHRLLAKDPSLARRFQPIAVEEPSVEQTVEILETVRDAVAAHHRVTIPGETLRACAELADVYIPDARRPAKAIQLLRDACAEFTIETIHIRPGVPVRDKSDHTLRAEDVAATLSGQRGIPVEAPSQRPGGRIDEIETALRARVRGQGAALDAVMAALRKSMLGLEDANKPRCVLFFVGPSGVGKTLTAQALSHAIFGSELRLVRFDMSEFMEKHTVTRFLGAPPSYLGHGEPGALAAQLSSSPHAVVLFDEVEKAHPDILNIFLQIFDNGAITDNNGTRIDFTKTYLILTSNLPITPETESRSVGFRSNKEATRANTPDTDIAVRRALAAHIRPEIVNRIDKVISFRALERNDLLRILEDYVREQIDKMKTTEMDIILEQEQQTLAFLLDAGYSREFGVRELKRAAETLLIEPLAEIILNQISPQCILVQLRDNKITFTIK